MINLLARIIQGEAAPCDEARVMVAQCLAECIKRGDDYATLDRRWCGKREPGDRARELAAGVLDGTIEPNGMYFCMSADDVRLKGWVDGDIVVRCGIYANHGYREWPRKRSTMNLNDFLSTMLLPESGSRRGIHWHAGTNTNMSPAMDDELKTVAKITAGGWLKVVSDGTGGEYDLMVAARRYGLVPICRIYQGPTGGPSDGHARFMERVAKDIGKPGKRIVFEIFNEPDLGGEWPGQPSVPPKDWLEITVSNWLRFYPVCINAGVIPAFPATASGVYNPLRPAGYWDPDTNPYLWLKQAGVTEFVDTTHPYGSNHTECDYPYDPINQNGAPVTDAEWNFPGVWRWPGDDIPGWLRDKLIDFAWDGRSRAAVNEQRMRDKNPGDGILDDDTAWLATIVKRKMLCVAGYDYVPMLSTEDGPVHGISEDARYPRNVAATMIRAIAWRLQFMHLFPWMLTTTHWLYGQDMLSGGTGGWQNDCWRTHRHDEFYATPGLGYQPVAIWLMNRPLAYDAQGFVEGAGLGLREPDWTAAAEYLGEEVPPQPDPDPEPPPDPDPAPPLPPVENDATAYGVTIIPAVVAAGETYWRITRVHHLAGAENNGNHHVFVDVIDRDGRRVQGAKIVWGWVGGESSMVTTIDKTGQYGADIPIDSIRQIIFADVLSELDSDRVEGLSTAHPDEPPGNTLGHHSFAVIWQLADAPDEPEPEPEPDPEPTPVTDEDIRNAAWHEADLPWNPTAALQAYARDHDLGAPLTDEFDVNDTVRAQGFVGAILWCYIGDWQNIHELEW